MKTISFIGAGNMGGAVAQAVCKVIDPREVVLFDIDQAKARALAEKTGCVSAATAGEAVEASRIVILCVKPQYYESTTAGLLPHMTACLKAGEKKAVASIMAGVSVKALEDTFAATGFELPVVRILPNTPALVGKGLFLMTGNDLAKETGVLAEVRAMLAAGGIAEETTEHMINLSSTLYSCSPAWVYMFIEALADGGVEIGVPRAQALRYSAMGVLGAAAMVLETGEHPGALKDAVCSPGGITIEGLATLERYAMRSGVIQAVADCEKKRQAISR